jgi:succinate-semialdehyde dehydrogenase / glutarate-semialdehyde dehydrogenase
MNTFKSINPYTNQEIAEYTEQQESEIQSILDKSQQAFERWRTVPIADRSLLMKKAGKILNKNIDQYARTITLEMGKPISESRAEVSKCILACDYYAEHVQDFLTDQIIETEAQKSYVRHDPMGTILAIMPWNFPFWQVFRFAAPALTSGNTALLKHAPNVFGCALHIEEVFKEAGFPDGVFQNLIVDHTHIEKIIAHHAVKAVTLTGSERAGSSVAALAGKYLKKTVLELGGSNAFIVLADADIDAAVKIGVLSRMQNSGQSCIAAKRFIIEAPIYDEYVNKFVKAVEALDAGDPMDEATKIGPLARKDLADQLQRQVQESIKQGASVIHGGKQIGCYHEPTILGNVASNSTSMTEETFGPLAPMAKVNNEAEAFALAKQTKYGLGLTVFTNDIAKADSLAASVSDGAYFVNQLVKSDPRLPFGGTNRSGYGRELARDGMMEFVNRKTVYIK